jgi:RimJ/RimL family protein N-acetyltransferase
MTAPRLGKARRVQGKTLVFRDAAVDDAEFILGLRTDELKSRHLSRTSGALADQQAWLAGYGQRDGEAYFVIESLAGEKLGTVRLYDAQGDSFCWGSWILSDAAPSSAAIESALMVYAYALDTLGFTNAHFQVNLANERVCAFHERFGAQRVSQDDVEIEYTLANAAIREAMKRYARFLPDPLKVSI